MPRIFFSHATEDKGVVLQVYGRLLEAHPELDPWIDTYEIRAGQDLLDRIAEGMDQAERFFVFLSPRSIGKPWVRAEFKRALVQEITGIKPEFVVPVKLGGLDSIPAFMESKKYIDLDRLTETEWISEFHVAATFGQISATSQNEPNVRVEVVTDPERPHVVQLAFFANFWAADVSFQVSTAVPAADVTGVWASGGPRGSDSYSKLLEATRSLSGWLEFPAPIDTRGGRLSYDRDVSRGDNRARIDYRSPGLGWQWTSGSGGHVLGMSSSPFSNAAQRLACPRCRRCRRPTSAG